MLMPVWSGRLVRLAPAANAVARRAVQTTAWQERPSASMAPNTRCVATMTQTRVKSGQLLSSAPVVSVPREPVASPTVRAKPVVLMTAAVVSARVARAAAKMSARPVQRSVPMAPNT